MSAAGPPRRVDPGEVVRLTVPARPEFVQVLRVAVRVVSGRAGCSDDARSRLQAAVGAAFFEVIDRAEPDARVAAVLAPEADRMVVALHGSPPTTPLDPTAVAGLADGHAVADDGRELRLWVDRGNPA